jgi:hypothetical protein
MTARVLLCLLIGCSLFAQTAPLTADVLVVGATLPGIAAAVNAAQLGHSVVLTEEGTRVGGMAAGGLSYTDSRTLQALQGTFRDYMERVEAYYREIYGADSLQVREGYHGIHAEPRVALHVMEQMLKEQPRIRLLKQHAVLSTTSKGNTLQSAAFEDLRTHATLLVQARVFIDATYEGDLMAASKAAYRVGRESTREYGERFAGHIYFQKGVLLYGGTGEGDRAIQCYNFRVTMTDRPDNRVMVNKPEGYDRSRFTAILPFYKSGQLQRAFSEDHTGILRIQRIPNGKADINDINTSPVGFGLPGRNFEYPEGNRETRRRIFEEHRTHALGLLYFLQNDSEVPELIRNEARQWGLPRDEFQESGNFPTQLYVREARRLEGRYVFTQHDVEIATGTARAKHQPDSVAVNDYPLNSHGVAPAGQLYPDVREGYLVYGSLPVQIPYGVMVPKTITNLLVPVAVSASNVGFSSLRMEPAWTALGQAAGVAAHLALEGKAEVAKVPVERLQRMLHERGASTFYFSDVLRTHPQFAFLQRLGDLGFFHEPSAPGFRLNSRKIIYGLQYFEPPEGHAALLDGVLTQSTLQYWRGLIAKAGKKAPEYRDGMTRGEYLGLIAKSGL